LILGYDWIHLAEDRDPWRALWTRQWIFGLHKYGEFLEYLGGGQEEVDVGEKRRGKKVGKKQVKEKMGRKMMIRRRAETLQQIYWPKSVHQSDHCFRGPCSCFRCTGRLPIGVMLCKPTLPFVPIKLTAGSDLVLQWVRARAHVVLQNVIVISQRILSLFETGLGKPNSSYVPSAQQLLMMLLILGNGNPSRANCHPLSFCSSTLVLRTCSHTHAFSVRLCAWLCVYAHLCTYVCLKSLTSHGMIGNRTWGLTVSVYPDLPVP
jgi:hypothetical protein